MRNLVLFISIIIITSCVHTHYRPTLEEILQHNPSLQQVLDHCQGDSLKYEAAKGALLYLKNHSGGVDERIFDYHDGVQRYW